MNFNSRLRLDADDGNMDDVTVPNWDLNVKYGKRYEDQEITKSKVWE